MGRKFYSDRYNRAILDESDDYLLTCEYEYVFLKNKITNIEICIDNHYGDPSSGLIVFNKDDEDTHVIITGYGLSIYDIQTEKLFKFWDRPDNAKYPDGLYPPSFADEYQFAFVMTSDSSKELRVFMGNAKTHEFNELK